jgi:hypothetical protein
MIPDSIKNSLSSRGLVINKPNVRKTFQATMSTVNTLFRGVVDRMLHLDHHDRETANELLEDLVALKQEHDEL